MKESVDRNERLFVVKRVQWNPGGYRGPLGVDIRGGFPGKYGYGMEEYNNDPDNVVVEGGVRYRVFHAAVTTQRPGRLANQPASLCLVAGGRKDLKIVCLAEGARWQDGERSQKLRDLIGLADRWKSAWAVSRMQTEGGHTAAVRNSFRKQFRKQAAGFGNWICREVS